MHNVIMPAPRSSFARLKFAPVARVDRVDRVDRINAPRDVLILDVPREEGLALLDWLGLGRPEFGAIKARELAPRCRRRLWNIERNAHAALRARTNELLAIAEAAGEGMVFFG